MFMANVATALRRVNVIGLLTMALLVGLWEALVGSGVLDYQFLPAPSGVGRATGTLLSSGTLVADLLHTLEVALLGFTLAAVLGVGVGLLLGLSDAAWRNSMASLEVVRAIPPVSLVPLALLLFGFSVRMELTVSVFVSAWPTTINTINGVRGVRPELLDVALMLRMSPATRLRKILLPASMPSIVIGLRLSLSLCLVLAVVAEMIGNPSGLGNGLVRSQQALQPEQMFAYVLTIGVLGVVLNGVFRYLSARAVPTLSTARAGR